MKLWSAWLMCVWSLRTTCTRQRTFLWMVVVLAAMSIRSDRAGVTSFIRSHWLVEKAYSRLLHFFHSPAVKLDILTRLWVHTVLRIFEPFVERVHGRIVVLADGIKVPKEGRKMPSVRRLHQESACNTKPPFIMGHSCQAVSLLVRNRGVYFAVPLACRIHEGLVFCNAVKRSLLDRLIELIRSLQITGCYVVADAAYASQKIARPLLETGDHLITRFRTNAVAFRPLEPTTERTLGRPRKYGAKVKLRELFQPSNDTHNAYSSVYGDRHVPITYRYVDLLWKPTGTLVRIVAVHHPSRGKILLMTTDLTLDPLDVLRIYSLRFKIEVSFKQAVHTIGTYAYRFWMLSMKKIRRRSGNQYVHRKTEKYRAAVRRKMAAYHRHIQLGIVAQGLLQYLSITKHRRVWKSFFRGTWFRTTKPHECPSELVVAHALRNTFPAFLLNLPRTHILAKFLRPYLNLKKCPGFKIAS